MNKKISNTFKSGYKIQPKLIRKSNSKKKKSIVDFDNSASGIVPFILITLVYILLLIICLSLAKTQNNIQFKWQNIIMSVASVALILNLFWCIGRTGFCLGINFTFLKILKKTKILELRNKILKKKTYSPITQASSYEEYEELFKMRKSSATKWMYISLLVYIIVFIVSILIGTLI